MAELDYHACSYWVVRYNPNLVRDEWLNVGVMLVDPQAGRFEARFIEEDREFGRVRKLQPDADETILRGLKGYFQTDVGQAEDPGARLEKLFGTLSTTVVLAPARGVLAMDFGAELDRLYDEHVAPPRSMSAAGRWIENRRGAIKGRVKELLRRAGLLGEASSRALREPVELGVRVEEFTYRGDPLRVDYSYRYNGTRGFAEALSLERDASLAKVFAYTAERIRPRLASTRFTAFTEIAPQAGNERHQFIVRLLEEQEIELVPPAELEGWVNELRSKLVS